MKRLRVLASLALLSSLGACGDDSKPMSDKPQPPPVAPAPSGGYGYAANLGPDLDRKTGDALKRGRNWLSQQRDEATGTYAAKQGPPVGFTAFGALAWMAASRREELAKDPALAKSLDWLVAQQKADGSIWSLPHFRNYETSVAVSAFAGARLAKYRRAQDTAREFLLNSQIVGDPKNPAYGGFSYGSDSPEAGEPAADLSNGQFTASALHDAGLPAGHEAWKRLLVFTGRVQNRSESNPGTVASKDEELGEVEVASGNDGGGFYAPGVSKAGLTKRADGRYEARSYGSMTYALLGCDLFAGLKSEDPRVMAAFGWISRHWTLDRNPGFELAKQPAKASMQGYFYYLLTMARTLAEYERSSGKPVAPTDADGKSHEWRGEIAQKILSLQHPDGSWVNEGSERWEEGVPFLVTCYAMQALAYCQGRSP